MYTIERFQKRVSVKDYIDGYVNVEEFEECCKVCPNYGKVWSCPPYNFKAEDYWEGFSELIVFARKIVFNREISPKEAYNIMFEVKKDMSQELFEMEKEIIGSVSLSAGSCDLCEDVGCTRASQLPCRYPQTMRYSIESIGGNVGLTVSKFMGIKLQWIEEGKVPPYYVLVGGLLKK